MPCCTISQWDKRKKCPEAGVPPGVICLARMVFVFLVCCLLAC